MINKNALLNFAVIASLLFFCSSCIQYKTLPYFQDIKGQSVTTEKITNYSPLLIQTNDVLGINVTSRNPESSSIFNYNLSRENGNNFNTSPDNPVFGFRVDEKGYAHLPLIGEIKVAGYTTDQIRDSLYNKLTYYYKDPVVNIRILNFKVSVFGDVARPNVYLLEKEQTSITEVLTMAGDLNITALRKNVLLIRVENGERKYIHLDLTSKNLMESPYYYLKNNDQIYVQPGRAKSTSISDSGFRIATLVLSALSIIAILISHYYQ